jgi:pyruvate/2-oxoglutarate dehydrogenase complex dihydrolipoamide dehydrogenase (E3) component
MNYEQIPWIIYTDSEIFQVGLTEKEAKDSGIDVLIFEVPLNEVDRFIADHESKGLVKIIKVLMQSVKVQVIGCRLLFLQ